MRYIGIDYGTKRIGIALSDESGTLAFPHSVIPKSGTIEVIRELAAKENVTTVVLGESFDFRNQANPVMERVIHFKEELEKMGLSVVYESEGMTSAQAARNPAGENSRIASPGKSARKSETLDSSAAALILQSFLDRRKTSL